MDHRQDKDGGTSKPASEADSTEFDIDVEDDGDAGRGRTSGSPATMLPPG